MSDWVRNKVNFYASNERLKELKHLLHTKNDVFDFNKIIPMPESLNVEAGSTEKIAIAVAKVRRKHKENWVRYLHLEGIKVPQTKTYEAWADLGETYLSNQEKYGTTTWYDWCEEHWGTKWNACDARWGKNYTVTFDTAWNAPIPIFKQLSKLFPDIEFECSFACEDLETCGYVSYLDNEFNVMYENDYDTANAIWEG